ncbi:MAG: 5'-nucleotidase, lipoprotein e(P4) family [Planctomycetaceae bacterium]
MHGRPYFRPALFLLAVVGAASAVRGQQPAAMATPAAAPAAPHAIPSFKPEDPPGRSLDANLFVQTSAEYRACCLQAYNLASLRLAAALAKSTTPSSTLAVVLDLDETVLDNGAFQSMMIRSRLAYDQRLWDLWEAEHWDKWELVPGAKDFILQAAKAGVHVVYVSNRNEKFRPQTKQGLERLGLPLADEAHLKLASDTSDKTARRAEAEKAHTVVLHVGDNLRDFDEAFRAPKLTADADAAAVAAAIRHRKDAVDRHAKDWGDRWIVIPNPIYGEWMKPLDRGLRDVDQLVPE